ncbi:DNA repair protein RadA [Persephonella sp.]
MGKNKTFFVCLECGYSHPTWSGKCMSCGSWNTLVEEKKNQKNSNKNFRSKEKISPVSITKIEKGKGSEGRLSTGIKTLDEAVGGGIVKGQVILISGQPGIGKSTLLLQVTSNIADRKKVLYVTAEESVNQIYLRGSRIKGLKDNLFVVSETNFEIILEVISELKPEFLVLDSIQTVYSENLESAAGSVSQVREISGKITEIAKKEGISVVIVGQVTKEGSIAGPKVLEHIVDTVVQFEGERGHAYRVLKVVKNRFGPSGEIAVFSMNDSGLTEVENPSSIFLLERPEDVAGSIIFPYTEGSKPVLIEIQALVSKTFYPVPQRKTQGVDINRLSIITAILEKEVGLNLRDKDIFINVVGGLYIKEPALDLPLALAVFSSYRNKPIHSRLAAFGELGLTGEIRSVHFTEHRIKEAEKFGFDKILIPFSKDVNGKNIIKVKNIKDAVKVIQ